MYNQDNHNVTHQLFSLIWKKKKKKTLLKYKEQNAHIAVKWYISIFKLSRDILTLMLGSIWKLNHIFSGTSIIHHWLSKVPRDTKCLTKIGE